MRKIWFLIAIAVFCMFTSGCSDTEQVDDLILVQAIGIDKEEDGYKLTLQTYDTRNAGGEAVVSAGSTGIMTIKCKGDNIYSALKTSELYEGEKVFVGHNMLVVLGKEITGDDIGKVLEYFVEDETIYPGVKIASTKGDAEKIVNFKVDEDIMSAVMIDEVIERNIKNGFLSDCSLVSVVSGLEGVSQSCVIPCLEIVYNSMEEGSVAVTGSSVFYGGYLEGELTPYETQGLLWLTDKVDTMYMTVDYENSKMAVYIDDVSVRLSAKKDENSQPVIEARIKCDANQQNLSSAKIDKDDLSILEETVRREIEGQCSACLSKSAGVLGVDILSVGRLYKFYDKGLYSDYQRDTDQFLKNLSYELYIDVVALK